MVEDTPEDTSDSEVSTTEAGGDVPEDAGSNGNDGFAGYEDFDAYVDDLADESLQALDEVGQLVEDAASGAQESEDLHKNVRDVLNRVQEGDAFGAARAVLDAFSGDDRKEAEEAVDAAKEVMGELEDTRAEGADVVELLVDAANEIEDDARALDVKERINELVN